MTLESLPGDLVSFDANDGAVHLKVDDGLYPLEAVYSAAYVFIDRCYVLLDKPAAGQTRVTLSGKSGALTAETGRELVGEFANELLSCAWRAQIARENRATIEAVTAQALSGARGAPTLEELEAFDFSDDAFEDPLGIAMSWEEKYAKKKGEAKPGAYAAKAEPKADAPAKAEGKPEPEASK